MALNSYYCSTIFAEEGDTEAEIAVLQKIVQLGAQSKGEMTFLF
tara:strand:+ start:235 stop:366 length:132 start_codon:yes stop_codon:yes gene_type:complete